MGLLFTTYFLEREREEMRIKKLSKERVFIKWLKEYNELWEDGENPQRVIARAKRKKKRMEKKKINKPEPKSINRKTCKQCGIEQPERSSKYFTHAITNKDGLSRKCRDCVNENATKAWKKKRGLIPPLCVFS